MRIKVTHGLHDLAADMRQIPRMASRDAREAVRAGAVAGNRDARRRARAAAGPHGEHFYKRIKADRPAPNGSGPAGWSAEYGPTGTPKTEFVGAGFRNGGGNDDLDGSRDLAAMTVADHIRRAMNGWFWA